MPFGIVIASVRFGSYPVTTTSCSLIWKRPSTTLSISTDAPTPKGPGEVCRNSLPVVLQRLTLSRLLRTAHTSSAGRAITTLFSIRIVLRHRRQWDEASELSGVRNPFQVIDDPKTDGRIGETGLGKGLSEALCHTIAVERDNGESLHLEAARCLSNPVVEDLGGPDHHRANDVGMDIDAFEMKDFVGAPANLRA